VFWCWFYATLYFLKRGIYDGETPIKKVLLFFYWIFWMIQAALLEHSTPVSLAVAIVGVVLALILFPFYYCVTRSTISDYFQMIDMYLPR
jgi:hypothetical protein